MATELASAYVTIIPSLKGASSAIENALGGINTNSIGKKSGSGFMSGLVKFSNKGFGIMTKGVAGIGAAVSALAVGGGISRAMKLDNAEMKFNALGINVEKAMKSCNEAVSGTAFGLDAAATIAASLGASGVKAGDEMTTSLKAVAGMAAMGGVSMERAGLIFGQVASKGRLQGDELLQFSEMGVNAVAALSKHLGKSQTEVREMVSAGKIDFKTFSDAMYATFGDAAKGANETFSGAMANVQAALSRIGAKFATPALEGLRKVFVALIPAIDAVSKALDPVVDVFTKFVEAASADAVTAIETFVDALNNGSSFAEAFAAAFDTLPDTVQRVITVIGGLGAAISAIAIGSKVVAIDSAIGGVVAKFTPLANATARFKEGMAAVKSGSTVAADAVAAFGGKSGALGVKFGELAAKVASSGGGIKGFGAILRGALASPIGIAIIAITALVGAFVYLWNTSSTFRAQMQAIGAQLMASLKPAIDSIKVALLNIASAVMPVINQALQTIVPIITLVASAFLQLAATIIPIIAQILAQVIPAVAQIISVIVQVASAILSVAIPVIQAILGVVQAVMPLIQAIITTVLNVIKGVVKAVTSAMKGDWSGAWNAIKGIASSVWNGIKSIVSSAINAVNGVINSVLGGIKGAWNSAWNSIKGFFSNIWNGLKSSASEGISGIMDKVSGIKDKITGAFSDAVNWLKEAGENIISGFLKGLEDKFKDVESFVNGIGDWIAEHKGPKAYDLALLIPNGGWIMQSLATGITNAIPTVQNALSDVTGALSSYDVSPYGSISVSPASASGASAATSGGTVYNVYFNNNKVNDDDEIKQSFNDLMRTMARKGAM